MSPLARRRYRGPLVTAGEFGCCFPTFQLCLDDRNAISQLITENNGAGGGGGGGVPLASCIQNTIMGINCWEVSTEVSPPTQMEMDG